MLEKQRGNVLSLDCIKSELNDPDAAAWATANPTFFEADNVAHLGAVSSWVMDQARFRQDERNRFLSKADPRLIAHALASGHTVVTMEVAAPAPSKKVKIPDVCAAFNVPVRNTFEVLTTIKAKFVLEKF